MKMDSRDCILPPTVAIGDFYRSFMDMCRQQKIGVPVEIKMLPKREPLPNEIFVFVKSVGGKSVSEKSLVSPLPYCSSSTSITSEEEEPPTAAKLYVELDVPEVGDSVTQMLIKDWKIDERMFKVLMKSCVHLQMLSKIKLFKTGITSNSMKSLIKWLAMIPNLKSLSLDNNPIPNVENHYTLLNKPLELREVSFRFCNITDKGAELIANNLGRNLVKLNLTGNEISDDGAISLAKALRLNCTLVSLSLAGNKIGNKGAVAFANMLSLSKASEDEVRSRRILLFEKISRDPTFRRDKIIPPYKHLLDEDCQRTARESSEDEILEEKMKVTRSLSLQKEWTLKTVYNEDMWDDQLMPVSSCKSKFVTETRCNGFSLLDTSPQSILINKMTYIQKKGYFLVGNFNLLHLNLARNDIGFSGLRALNAAVMYQQTMSCKKTTPGLCKLTLTGNRMDETSALFTQIEETMEKNDPISVYLTVLHSMMTQSLESVAEL